MRAIKALLLLAVVLTVMLPSAVFAETEETAKITDIQISGNIKVEADTIKSKMSEKVGDVFMPSAVSKDIEAIYKMGYFDDIRVEAEGYSGGLRLIFTVVERPILRSISFEGNKHIDSAKLREKVNITPYSVYNPSLVADNVQTLQLYYQSEGYFNAKVIPIIDKVSDKEDKLIFLVDEGGKVRINTIKFVGNENISSRKLRKAMTTKEYFFLWSWVTGSGTYKLYDFSMDMERLKAVYFDNGYIQASISEPEIALNEAKDELNITIRIHEGVQFDVGKITTTGNKVISSEKLLGLMESKSGEIMNRDLLKQDIVTMTDAYGSMGYAFANITPVITPDVDKRLVDIELQVDEAQKIYVNRIEITGNNKTRDNVIRRELPFQEGQKYDTSSLKRSKEVLKNLDYFETVDVVPERIPDTNEVNLDVKVKEKSTGSFSIGGGYSTVDRLMAIGEIKQKNLFGRGQQLTFRAQWGSRRHDFSLSFMEPWLLGKPVSLGVELFNEERNQNIGFSVKTTGGSITLGRRFWDYWSLAGTYSYSANDYFDVSDTNLEVSPPGAFDKQVISKLGMSLSRDTRDNYTLPHRGSRSSLYGEISADFLGSDRSYYKGVADTVKYFPFYWDTVFSLHARAGVIYEFNGSEVPPSELFYVGGINTIRGYDWGSIGPRPRIARWNLIKHKQIDTIAGQVLGGNKELIMNAEYTFPLVNEINLFGVMFFDAGNSYGHGEAFDISKLRYTAGGGFRWMSPMGLIRLEYGKVLDHTDPEQTGKWEFSIGTMF